MSFHPIDDLLTDSPGQAAWELFHENSKTSRRERHSIFALPPSDATIVRGMNQLRTVKPYVDFPTVPLPDELPAVVRSFDEVLESRTTARGFENAPIPLSELAKILYCCYGVRKEQEATEYPRPFRTIPSGGALYPLEIYVHARRVEGLGAGLYHYDPERSNLDVLRLGDESDRICASLFQPDLGKAAAATLFISAVFFRSTFKYGDRGYRFVLLEAGHMVQNAALTACALGLGATPLGGYLDRSIDRYLSMDGLSESVVYMCLLGRTPESGADGGSS